MDEQPENATLKLSLGNLYTWMPSNLTRYYSNLSSHVLGLFQTICSGLGRECYG